MITLPNEKRNIHVTLPKFKAPFVFVRSKSVKNDIRVSQSVISKTRTKVKQKEDRYLHQKTRTPPSGDLEKTQRYLASGKEGQYLRAAGYSLRVCLKNQNIHNPHQVL